MNAHTGSPVRKSAAGQYWKCPACRGYVARHLPVCQDCGFLKAHRPDERTKPVARWRAWLLALASASALALAWLAS